MQRLINECQHHEGQKYELISVTALTLQEMICGFCEGHGHNATECATKKKLDKTFSKLGLKTEWGTIKSGIIRDNVEVARIDRPERRNIRQRLLIQQEEARVVARRQRDAEIARAREIVLQQQQAQQQPQQPPH